MVSYNISVISVTVKSGSFTNVCKSTGALSKYCWNGNYFPCFTMCVIEYLGFGVDGGLVGQSTLTNLFLCNLRGIILSYCTNMFRQVKSYHMLLAAYLSCCIHK